MLASRDTWYLVHSRPRQEEIAAENLARQGYRVYLPRLRLPRRRRDRWLDEVEPLFPRYLFAGLKLGDQEFRPMYSTRGVSRVVRFGLHYAAVPPALIDALEAQAGEDGTHAFRAPGLKAGDRVRILAGPFRDVEAVFECERGEDRVRVLLMVLGAEARVTLGASLVVPAVEGFAASEGGRSS